MSDTPTRTRSERRRRQQALVKEQKKQGRYYPSSTTLPNRKSDLKTVNDEQEAIGRTTEEQLKVYKRLLPGLLKRINRIPDPRHPKKVKHQMDVLMLYGIFMFVFHLPSRREANRELTTPQLMTNLQAVFPELTDLPHQDTLCRLLEALDVDQIETVYTRLLKQLIQKKTFQDLLLDKRYVVAVDGTQKYKMDDCWDERYLRRKLVHQDGTHTFQYYAYVLEAVLILNNGMVLPLVSEFLENSPELEAIENEAKWKQDCELKAFHRLADRLKRLFPRLPITLLLDGLYANGPVLQSLRNKRWQFMIVLKEGSLPSVWKEAHALLKLNPSATYEKRWQGREQRFRWVNDLEYTYGTQGRHTQTLHVVTCEERWEEVDRDGNIVVKTKHHAWISSQPLHKKNVHKRCNLVARKRWLQENNILKEKHQGYQYDHIFSYDWNAMRGYHYLMHIARMMNELALHALPLLEHVKEVGVRAFIRQFREVMSHRELDLGRIRRLLTRRYQLRLVREGDGLDRR